MDAREVQVAFRKLRDAAADAMRESVVTREAAELYRARMQQAKAVLNATRDSEEADQRLDELRNHRSPSARLGALLAHKNIKVSDIVQKWDVTGSGEVDRLAWRFHVGQLGLQAEPAELDEIFDSLDAECARILRVVPCRSAIPPHPCLISCVPPVPPTD